MSLNARRFFELETKFCIKIIFLNCLIIAALKLMFLLSKILYLTLSGVC